MVSNKSLNENDTSDLESNSILDRGNDVYRESDEDTGENLLDHDQIMKDNIAIKELDTYDDSGIVSTFSHVDNPEDRRRAEQEMKKQQIRRYRKEGKKIPLELLSDPEEAIQRYMGANYASMAGIRPGEAHPGSRVSVSLEDLNTEEKSFLEHLEREEIQNEIKKRFRRFITTFSLSDDAFGRALDDSLDRSKSSQKSPRNPKKKKDDFSRDTRLNKKVYVDEIHRLCSENLSSLSVDYNHLHESEETLALYLGDEPRVMLRLFDLALASIISGLYPNYLGKIVDSVHVRIVGLPVKDSIRDLRCHQLNGLVRVSGVVTKRGSPKYLLSSFRLKCRNCAAVTPEEFGSLADTEGLQCEACGGSLFERSDEHLKYSAEQNLTIQESPGSVPAGRIPRQVGLIIEDDLVDSVKPGQRVDVTGVYVYSRAAFASNNKSLSMGKMISSESRVDHRTLSSGRGLPGNRGGSLGRKVASNESLKNRFPVFKTEIIVNSMRLEEEMPEVVPTAEDVQDIIKLSKKKDLIRLLVKSFAPSLHGHSFTKKAILLSLVAGVSKTTSGSSLLKSSSIHSFPEFSPVSGKAKQADSEDARSSGMRIRGDINVLLVGDPGTAKSQFLKYASALSPRGIYTAGKGASAAGLTAAVRIDPMSREWTLEGGALVMADRGICCIDEFEKMNDKDRTSIHEAMEQQTISISKAGIVATLSAQCAVLAASNPIRSHYDSNKSVSRNSGLSDAILSRFDIIVPLLDRPDPIEDERLAGLILSSHIKSAETSFVSSRRAQGSEKDFLTSERTKESEGLSQGFLRKYIEYCRSHSRPLLSRLNKGKLSSLYSLLRQESHMIAGSHRVAIRHIESIIRISEAFAKLRLRKFVEDKDLDSAIQIFLQSFIEGQKFGIKKQLRKRFSEFLSFEAEENEIIMYVLHDLIREKVKMEKVLGGENVQVESVEILVQELEKKCSELDVEGVEVFLKSEEFKKQGFALDSLGKCITVKFD